MGLTLDSLGRRVGENLARSSQYTQENLAKLNERLAVIEDARAAYSFAAARYPATRIVIWGESLGTGVAIALAAEKPVARLMLQAPFTSTVDVASDIYWFLPVRLLVKDQFRSDERIGKVMVPVLILHGERDRTVPIRYGERLYAMIAGPKRFVRFPEGGHNDLDQSGATETALRFLAEPLN